MDRKWKSGAAGAAPALDNASDGFATAGNPGTGVPATKPGPHWYHMVTEELLALVANADIAFDKADVTQVRAALQAMFGDKTLLNGKLTFLPNTPVAGAMRIALKTLAGNDPSPTKPVFVAFRHSDLSSTRVIRSVTGPLSADISAGSTFSHVAARDQSLFVFLLDNAGAVEFALSNFPMHELAINRNISTTAEGGAGGADDSNTIYSAVARPGVPLVCIARAVSNQAVAGTWAAAPVRVDMAPFIMPNCRFEAYRGGTDQAVANTTFTKAEYNTEQYDPDSVYDLATFRYQPNVAGQYLLNAAVKWLDVTDQGQFLVAIYRNGAEIKRGHNTASGASTSGAHVSATLQMNGTSDYLEVFVWHSFGVSKNVQVGQGLNWFHGMRVGA